LIEPFVVKEKFDKIPQAIKPLIEILQVTPLAGEASIRINAFVPTAILFFIFSLPCFIFVRPHRRAPNSQEKPRNSGIFKELIQTLKSAKKYKNVFMFLIANFLFMDAVHTVIAFMSVFASKAVGFSDSGIIKLFILSTSAAVFGSILWGIVADIIGHKKTLIYILICWLAVIALSATTENQLPFYGIGALCGIAMGGVWVTTRPLVIALSPDGKTGEFLGLYSMTGKCASILGPLIWGIMTFIFDSYGTLKYRIAIITLGLLILASLFFLKQVKMEKT